MAMFAAYAAWQGSIVTCQNTSRFKLARKWKKMILILRAVYTVGKLLKVIKSSHGFLYILKI